MKKLQMKKIYLILFLLVVSRVIFAQDYSTEFNSRTIVLSYSDSIIKANILNTDEEYDIKDDLKYFWYNNDIIGFNRGGVNGNPLHGTYTVSNNEGLLLIQGEFKHGLKVGKWKIWYTSGELKSLESWKNGLKHEDQTYYSENGDVITVVKFKNGVEDDGEKTSFIKSVFSKKEKEEKAVNDSTEINVEASEQDLDI